MSDNRTYIRVIFDKLLKDNVIFAICGRIVKFYYVIFSHPVKLLKFEENCPLNRESNVVKHRFGIVNSKTNILG